MECARAATHASPQQALVAGAALPLVIYGYALIETLRTCRLQTSVCAATGYGRAPMNTLSASERQWTHEDRDIVTPANDLLYFCGWVNLADGPVTLRIPPLPEGAAAGADTAARRANQAQHGRVGDADIVDDAVEARRAQLLQRLQHWRSHEESAGPQGDAAAAQGAQRRAHLGACGQR